ncbi:MAG: thymidine phosphorylase [candidate division WOR-3 bacterium]|nr:MAG: thymidine phosphorylase [candidate division WOR-3 bacterium]
MKFHVIDLIHKKRSGKRLNKEEIHSFISGYTWGTIPDYQMAAFLMAVYFQGMDFQETTNLTQAMMHSGTMIRLADIKKPKIDKHSTGGIGDKVSLVLAPLVASCGVCVPMISGRGLGHTGGTLDKLESIPGMRTHLSIKEFKKQLTKIGVAMIGQTAEIAPADKKMYALRDVTATVDSIPLIAASIMSKKLAEGLDGLVLDVKFGSGAFMNDFEDAEELAETMIQIGKRTRVKVVALLTDMNNPLGEYIGNSLEIIEAIETLKNRGPEDLMELTIALGELMLEIAGIEGGSKILERKIMSGEALHKFKEIISHQGGDLRIIEDYSRLPVAKNKVRILAPKAGYIHIIDNFKIGMLLVKLGGGRLTKEDTIDPSCGFRIYKKIGDVVKKRECIGEILCDHNTKARVVAEELNNVFTIRKKLCRPKRLIREIIY